MRFIMLSIFIFISTTVLYASNPVIINDEIENYSIGKHLDILEDKTSKLGVNDVINPDMADKWFPSKWNIPNFGFTDSTYWFKFEIINQSRIRQEIILGLNWSLYDEIEIYTKLNNNYILLSKAGDLVPFENREIKHRNFIFKIPIKNIEQIYIRVKSKDSIQLPVYLYNEKYFYETEQITFYILGLFYGFLIVMILYNSFIYISIKDVNYLYYIIYETLHLLFQINYFGIGYQFIWSSNPWLQNHGLSIFLALGYISYLQFSKSFLNVKILFPKTNYAFNILIVFCFPVLILAFFNIIYTLIIINILAIIVSQLPFIVSIMAIMKGYKPARIFLISWIIFSLGGTLIALKNTGLIQSNIITNYSYAMGSLVEVVVLSLALAYRININIKENREAQQKIIEIQRSYSESLEKTVQERTIELEIEKNKLKSKNDILEGDIALAKKIQLQLIPEPDPTDYIYSLYKPMHEVGGDLYDFVHFRDSNKIGIFISDVSGHGVPAAFITSMIKTTILQSGNRKDDPAELMNYINDVLQNQTAGNFITAFYGIFEPDSNSILYANAGHPQPYIITDDGITQLPKGRNTALAMFTNSLLAERNKTYKNFKEILPANSKLLLYTDGLTETCPTDSSIFFENDVMMKVFMENRNFTSKLFIDNLFKRLIHFRGEDSFDDDVCLVCLDIT